RYPTTNKWEFLLSDEDQAGTAYAGVTSTTTAQVGTWVHLVGVYDAGTNQVRIYVDGVRDGTATLAFSPAHVPGALNVGRSLGTYWVGSVDQVQVYVGAMSDREVADLYQASN